MVRPLRRGEVLRDGDLGHFPANDYRNIGEFSPTAYAGDAIGKPWLNAKPYIRRKKKARK